MTSTYNKTFDNRVKNYIYAQEKYPNVMKNEFEIAIKICELKSNDKFVNIPADNGFLFNYIDKTIEYIPFEINENFSKETNYKLCKLNNLPLENNSIDKILSLASLHHFNNNDREEFYKEIKRILKVNNNGIFILGDVLKNSKQDKFLNEFVNKYNSNGHQGIFFHENDKFLLEKCGFNVIEIEYPKYKWNFTSKDEMCDYCINLFGLDLIISNEDVINGIKTYLDFYENKDDGCCYFIWQLIYFKSTISLI